MKFHICLANHDPVGRLTLVDMIDWVSAGLKELGHSVTVSPNSLDISAINLIWEQFYPGFAEELRQSKAVFGIVATEIPTGREFNHRDDGIWPLRFRLFPSVAKRAAFIWTTVEQTVPFYSQFAPTAYLELGFSEALIPEPRQVAQDVDFFFCGLATPHRRAIIEELQRHCKVVWPSQILSKEDLSLLIARSKIGLSFRQSPTWPVPSPTRLGRLLMAKKGIVSETTPVVTRQSSLIPLLPPEVNLSEFALQFLRSGEWKVRAEEAFEEYRRTMPMREIMHRVLTATVPESLQPLRSISNLIARQLLELFYPPFDAKLVNSNSEEAASTAKQPRIGLVEPEETFSWGNRWLRTVRIEEWCPPRRECVFLDFSIVVYRKHYYVAFWTQPMDVLQPYDEIRKLGVRRFRFRFVARLFIFQKWLRDWARQKWAEDSGRSVVVSATHFIFGTLLSRASGLLRDIAMARCFGSGPEVAAFMVAYRLANLLRRLLGEGNLSAGFVPAYEALRSQNIHNAALFYRNTAWSLGFVSAGAALALGGSLLGLGFCVGSDWKEIFHLAAWMAPGLVFVCLFSLHNAVLQSQKRSFWAGFAPIAFNFAWICSAFAAAHASHSMRWLAIGITGAYLCQWLMTSTSVRRAGLGWKEWLRPKLLASDSKALLKPMSLGILGVGAVQINSALDAVFARCSDLAGPAYLWYAIRLQQLPLSLFGVAIASALLPQVTRAVSAGDENKYRELMESTVRNAAIFLIPCTVGLFLFGKPTIRLLFGHGGLSAADGAATFRCLQAYAVGLLPAGLILIYAQGRYARKDYQTPMRSALVAVIVNGALNTLFVFGLGWGPESIAWATSASAIVNCWLVARGAVVPFPFLVKLTLASILSGALVWLALPAPPASVVGQAIWLLCGGGSYLGVVFAFYKVVDSINSSGNYIENDTSNINSKT
jgi:putative peptidoglycan lipid II flippase